MESSLGLFTGAKTILISNQLRYSINRGAISQF